jgi:hypothetical protein
LYASVLAAKARQSVGQNIETRGIVGANSQVSLRTNSTLANCFQGLGPKGYYSFRITPQRGPRLRELDGLEIAIEKLSPEFLLQTLNLLAQSGLSAIKDARGAREIPDFGHLEESLEIIKAHTMAHSRLFQHVHNPSSQRFEVCPGS